MSAFDIVISGGGLVGATTALALSLHCPQLSIAVVEPIEPSNENQPSFDSRSIALAQGSANLLNQYGLWQNLSAHACAINKIHVSDRGHLGKSYIKAEQFNLSALGYVLEVRHLGFELHNAVNANENISWFCPNKIVQVEQHTEHVKTTLDDDTQLTAKVLLVADGGLSPTRQLLHIDNCTDDYGQHAIIANIAIDKPHQGVAFERFTENGPIALLPLTQNRYSLVWCVKPEDTQMMMSWSDEVFLAQLQHSFGYRAGVLTKAGKRSCYPLSLSLAKEIIGHRVALIGNASHTIHPIAGQGFNLGMRDIAALSMVISRFIDDPGTFEALNTYKQHRIEDLNKVVGMTDTLVRLFSNDSKLMALGRTMGLIGMQLFDCLKQPIAYQGMGLNVKSKE